MPSSPKRFTSRQTQLFIPRPSTALIFSSLIIGISGFVFGLTVFLTSSAGHLCAIQKRSVHVTWDTRYNSNENDVTSDENKNKRHQIIGFVGIQTGFSSSGRRQALRKTWMPSNPHELKRLEESTGLVFRFVIGRNPDRSKMSELRKEVEKYDDFLLLDIDEHYSELPYKTLAFFKAAYALFDSQFYVKADDDIYLRPDRLSVLLAKDRSSSQTYLGCMKKGPVFIDPKLKWYEPLSYLLGNEYFLHAYGPIYALSADVVASLLTLRNDSFRMFSNEDVMVGAWMLAMNVNHENSRALCEQGCTPSSIAVWDLPKCSGLCNPETRLLELHQMEMCSQSPTLVSSD